MYTDYTQCKCICFESLECVCHCKWYMLVYVTVKPQSSIVWPDVHSLRGLVCSWSFHLFGQSQDLISMHSLWPPIFPCSLLYAQLADNQVWLLVEDTPMGAMIPQSLTVQQIISCSLLLFDHSCHVPVLASPLQLSSPVGVSFHWGWVP